MTTGPWKPIFLEFYTSRISEIDIRTTINDALDAKVDVYFAVSGPSENITATAQILRPSNTLAIGATDVKLSDGARTLNFGLSHGAYEPWYPVGYGAQPLYTVEVSIKDEVS